MTAINLQLPPPTSNAFLAACILIVITAGANLCCLSECCRMICASNSAQVFVGFSALGVLVVLNVFIGRALCYALRS